MEIRFAQKRSCGQTNHGIQATVCKPAASFLTTINAPNKFLRSSGRHPLLLRNGFFVTGVAINRSGSISAALNVNVTRASSITAMATRMQQRGACKKSLVALQLPNDEDALSHSDFR